MNFIQDEMLTHVPMCVHPEPKKTLLFGCLEGVERELRKYKDIDIQKLSDTDVLSDLQAIDEQSIDVVIIASRLLSTDKVFWGLIKRALSTKGVISALGVSLMKERAEAKEQLEAMGEYFRIVMPYAFLQQECAYAVFASNALHPTADINLQRADLSEGFEYYNSDIAVAAFAMPNMIRKEFKGDIKS
ncbi:MAG: hypothetical protein JXQ68_01805 [Campylobacterales bacterium]|nr:hypothetical protein [Campylobacterales bacterium]